MLETGSAWPPNLDCEPLEVPEIPPAASLWRGAGFFNPKRPPRLAVCGSAALEWAAQHSADEIGRALTGSDAVLLDPAAAGSHKLRTVAGGRGWRCQQSAHVAVSALREAGLAAEGPTTCRHGVLVRVCGLGVLIDGEPASGKSELALALVDRGHCLIADDAVALWRLAPNLLLGSCPEPLFGFLHTRNLGLMHLPSHFGNTRCSLRTRVDLLVGIEARRRGPRACHQLLSGQRTQTEVAGVTLPQLLLDGDSAGALALCIEVACREHWHQLAGWQTLEALSRRQAELMHRSRPVTERS
jgi:serine kinase of HPr protein (carbohydrate metabolism regulator)